jgi:Na+/melibiose symporter-like transporter
MSSSPSPTAQTADSDTQPPPAKPEKKKFNFNRDLLPLPKLLFFVLNVLGYSLHAFQTKFFIKEWGFTAAKVGWMNAFQCINFMGSIVWSHLADKTGKHRTITVVCAFMFCAISSLGLWHLFDKNRWTGMVWAITLNTLASFFLSGLFPMIDAQVIAILSSSGSFSKDIFGRQRLWGSLGHSASTALSNLSRMIFRHDNAMFVFMNLSGILFIAVVVVVVPRDLKIEKGKGHHHHHGGEKKAETAPSPALSVQSGSEAGSSVSGSSGGSSSGGRRDLQAAGAAVEAAMAPTPMPPALPASQAPAKNPTLTLLKMPSFWLFLAFVLIAGYSRSIMSIYQKYFVSDVLKYGDASSVILDIVRPISEVVVFFFSKQILAALGVHWVLIISQVAGILRTVAYSFISKIPKGPGVMIVVYGVELLKGLNSGMLVSAAVKVAMELAPRGCENTAQGLFSGTYVGLAQAFAGVLGGALLILNRNPKLEDHEDVGQFEGMFLWSSILCAVAVLAFTLKYALVDRVIMTGLFGKKHLTVSA